MAALRLGYIDRFSRRRNIGVVGAVGQRGRRRRRTRMTGATRMMTTTKRVEETVASILIPGRVAVFMDWAIVDESIDR